jgi:hypothetical protein
MISYQSTKFWQRSWFAALIGGLAIGGGVWWWQSQQEAAQVTEVSSASAPKAAPNRMPALAAPMVSGMASTPTVLPDGRPSDFTPEDWAALKAAMSTQPNAKAETERVVSYLRFQRAFEQWQALADSSNVQQRHQLAENLIGQVPGRLTKGEVTMGEALLLSTALLTDLEPNEHLREQRLESVRAELTAAIPQPDERQVARDAERLAEFNRRQAAIVAADRAKPEGSRDPAALGRQLEEARRAVYDSKP